METLQITKQAAMEAHENAKNSGKKLLEDLFGKKTFRKNILERIKTFDDVLEELQIDKEDFNNALSITEEPDEQAYVKLKHIVDALNEGWTPDWTDGNQVKYYPWFKMGGSSGSGFSSHDYGYRGTVSDCGSRLCFKSAELAKYAGKQFTDIYKDFLTI